MTRLLVATSLMLTAFLLAGAVPEAVAQAAPGQGGQAASTGQGARSMRHFWHVFVAYAVAWLLLMGWLLAIVRRIARVERRLRG